MDLGCFPEFFVILSKSEMKLKSCFFKQSRPTNQPRSEEVSFSHLFCHLPFSICYSVLTLAAPVSIAHGNIKLRFKSVAG